MADTRFCNRILTENPSDLLIAYPCLCRSSNARNQSRPPIITLRIPSDHTRSAWNLKPPSMSHQTKRLVFALGLLCILIAGISWWNSASQDEKLHIVASQKANATRDRRHSDPSSAAMLLRYDPLKDPRSSAEAASFYYQRREQMIRSHHGDAQLDHILKGLMSRKDLLRWLRVC